MVDRGRIREGKGGGRARAQDATDRLAGYSPISVPAPNRSLNMPRTIRTQASVGRHPGGDDRRRTHRR
jgi:hypothetical protein